MEEKWKVIKNEDGSMMVITNSSNVVLLKSDGTTGYGFVREYLKMTGKNYRNHLIAVDLILQRQLGERYVNVRKIPNVYHSYLAMLSLSCRFSNDCALYAVCPFNGYRPSNKDKRMVGCNPIYELPLTDTQARAADMLVNTAYSLSDMAEVLGISESRMRSLASIVYAVMGVEGRHELVFLLRNKRVR